MKSFNSTKEFLNYLNRLARCFKLFSFYAYFTREKFKAFHFHLSSMAGNLSLIPPFRRLFLSGTMDFFGESRFLSNFVFSFDGKKVDFRLDINSYILYNIALGYVGPPYSPLLYLAVYIFIPGRRYFWGYTVYPNNLGLRSDFETFKVISSPFEEIIFSSCLRKLKKPVQNIAKILGYGA